MIVKIVCWADPFIFSNTDRIPFKYENEWEFSEPLSLPSGSAGVEWQYQNEDDIEHRKDNLLDEVEQRLKQQTTEQDLFTLRWKVI